jgi:hypothetical protein
MQASKMRSIMAVALLVSLWPGTSWAQALRAVGFNVESGWARSDVVDDLIAAAQGVDLWGFSEGQDPIWATMFAQATANGATGAFAPILGTTGGADWLLIVYHQARFDLVRLFERTDIHTGGNVRAPLVAHVRFKPAGPECLFMVTHLYRSNTECRHEQARLLNIWARQQTLPIIAVGDDHSDWDVGHSGEGIPLLETRGIAVGGLAMKTTSGQLIGGTAPSPSVRRLGTPPPTGEASMLIAVLGTKEVYQVAPGLLPPGQR